MKRPEPIPNIWPNCKIQVINHETNRWQTVAECLWTPNAIKATIKRLKIKNAWVLFMGERTPQF